MTPEQWKEFSKGIHRHIQEEDFQFGVQAERERIIKLLENEKFILPEGIDEGTTLIPIQDAIALIKGENK